MLQSVSSPYSPDSSISAVPATHSNFFPISVWQLRKQSKISVVEEAKRAACRPIRALTTSTTSGGGNSGGSALGRAHIFKVTAIVTIKKKHHPDYAQKFLEDLDAMSDSAGQKVILQLVSTKIDPETKLGKRSKESALKDWAAKAQYVADKVEYTAEFYIDENFGTPGAILILNEHSNEFYVETIALEGLPSGHVYFPCYSWVHSKRENPARRVFFSNKAYLPQNTPDGIKDLRESDKMSLRGNGRGVRKFHERIYDYAVYNDIGNPDRDRALARPILGGTEEFPYPRRCRTGRLPTKTDHTCESVLGKEASYYVPRDETFEEIKKETFTASSFKVILHQLIPSLVKNITKVNNHEFTGFTDIDRLYKEGMVLRELALPTEFFNRLWVPKFITLLESSISLQYSQPKLISKDRFAWLRDDAVGRQVLAGVNPMKIELMKSFPPVSNLDPDLYGPRESAIRADHIERQLGGLTVEKAIEQKKLFIVDYHDAYMPFIDKINRLNDRKMYASRSIFYLNTNGTLTPVAIELSVPGRQRVFTPGQDATTHWLWQLAKAHAACNSAGFHQLVNHWLRTHAAVEPYIIATHRRLSFMHPISKLLHPHLRYTLEINALARQSLINGGGVIETCFTPGPYSLEISSAAYKSMWRFDMESLPADLIRRGMAEVDPSSPYGLKLLIEDYPYAADGLLIWDAIYTWVHEYVSLYYDDPRDLEQDVEIHEWWDEIRHEGHPDKKSEPWWPELKRKEDLINILSTIIWIASAHHAAVNFGQYMYGGYVPNQPCMTRRLIPEQDEANREYQQFLQEPQKFFLSTISNRLQSTVVMSVLDSLSTHAPDEEYLGQHAQTNWTADAKAKAAATKFAKRMEEIERIIDCRNTDMALKNRTGAGVLPYELLRPTSGPGVTGRGVPNSISI